MNLVAVTREAAPSHPVTLQRRPTLEALVTSRTAFLGAYQDARYARTYADFVERVRRAEKQAWGTDALARAVAVNLAKLMAYKDEYEVARLYSDGRFREKLAQEFEGRPVLRFHLAPPILGRRSARGEPVKQTFGPWMLHGFRALAAMRILRGTRWDLFGKTAERIQERQLIADYRASIEGIIGSLHDIDMDKAIAIASVPEKIRGFGHVKQASIHAAREQWAELEGDLRAEKEKGLTPLLA